MKHDEKKIEEILDLFEKHITVCTDGSRILSSEDAPKLRNAIKQYTEHYLSQCLKNYD